MIINLFSSFTQLLSKYPAPIVLIITIILVLPVLYNVLYTKLNIARNLQSFLFFSINAIILFFFILNIIFIFCNKYSTPIYMGNLSLLSKYRYLLYSIITILCIIFLIFTLYNKKLYSKMQVIMYPYLQEEVRLTLYIWNNGFMGDYCIYIINKIYTTTYFKYYYFFCHFFIFYISRIFILYYFVLFCFFQGDLRNVLYLLPIAFFIWIFSFFDYYLNYFLVGNHNTIKDLIIVTALYPHDVTKPNIKKDLVFSLTKIASKKGYTNIDIEPLADSWVKLTHVMFIFSKYKKISIIVSLFIINIYVFLWLYLSYIFFVSDKINMSPWLLYQSLKTKLLPNPLQAKHVHFHSTAPLFAPRDARMVPEPLMNPLKLASKNAYSPGHIVVGELLPDGKFYKIDGSLTTGNYNGNNPIIIIMRNQLITGGYSYKDQKYIPFPESITIPISALGNVVLGSGPILETSAVKVILDAIHNSDKT